MGERPPVAGRERASAGRRPGQGSGVASMSVRGEPLAPEQEVGAMAAKPVHTVPHGDGWGNMREGGKRVFKIFGTKAEAAGRNTAMREKVEHLIHKADGSIGERNSYGNDRRDRPG